ncbi:MAG: T9SS type A sorting domain-containing protein [Bacteroidetes bacterium]|nr:T9SS type A sorting domain-containing protein [Bacteroidota bacterium]
MTTKTQLKTTGLTIFMMVLITCFTHAQIAVQGLAVDHEGTAVWDADGSGPEPAATGHIHPYGWGTCRYYGASRDYDDIDPDPGAALCHFLDDIEGFPLFEQALANNGFTAGQVKMKAGLLSLKNDIEGEDWFTFDDKHCFNYYDAHGLIELNGEPMISFYINYYFDWIASTSVSWHLQSTFSKSYDVSGTSSATVQEVAAAFLSDLNGQELRLVVDDLQSVEAFGTVNGRINGVYHEIVSGHLEKGFPELPFTGLAADHEGIAGWDADGTGPEPEATGHSFTYNGTLYEYSYYYASRDYDGIDSDPNAAAVHLTDIGTGFPNLEIQLAYRGYTIDQIKSKQDIHTFGNDVEGDDWGLNGNIHWWRTYGNTTTLELAGEPILQYVTDTNFSSENLNLPGWESHTNYLKLSDISANASADAQHVAMSFLKDLSGHEIQTTVEGNFAGYMPPNPNGREGVFHEISSGLITAKLPEGTHIWGGDVNGNWTIENSPYVIMDEINVPDGEILNIDPGVIVKFNTTKAFSVFGSIIAEGTEESPILFTAYDESVPWGGIGIANNAITNIPISLKHCIFEYSYAYNPDNLYGYNCGGAIRVDNYEQIVISHCTFRYNGADNPLSNNPCGGAVMISECSVHISHCIFYDNFSSWGGALAILDNSHPVIDNCLFYNNEATFQDGGAILSWTDSNPHFVNCTFADNHAVLTGGAAALQLGGLTTFTNCIFWGNSADNGANQISIWEENPPSLNVYYCNVESGLNGITPGFQGDTLGNIDVDPYFQTYGEYQYVPDSLLSLTLNVGTQILQYLPDDYIFPAHCLCGNPRIDGGEIDMGCYEYDDLGTGISNDSFNDKVVFSVFPNPINSNPTIEFYLEKESSVVLSIMDIPGRIIFEVYTQALQIGKNHLTWDAEKMAPGVYLCHLKIGNEVSTRKVVKIE